MPFPALPKAVMGLWFHHGKDVKYVQGYREDAHL